MTHHDGRERQEFITPKKFIFFGTDTEKTLFGSEPPGCFLKTEKNQTTRTFW